MTAWIRAIALLLGSVAEPPPPSIVVDGACDDDTALRERLAALVPASAPLGAIRLKAERQDTIWHGQLTFGVEGVTHERDLSAESCAVLYEASALVIGLTVQPDPAEEPSEAEPNAVGLDPPGMPEPPTAPEVELPASDPVPISSSGLAPTPTSSVDRALRGRGSVGAGVTFGVLHPVHPSLTLGGEIMGRGWVAGIDLLYLPPLVATLAPRTRAIVQLAALELRGCPTWHLANKRVVLPLCGGVAVGRSWASGEGDAIVGRRGRETWAALIAGPRVQLRSRWGGDLWLATELVVPLRRLNFVIDGFGPACCERPVGGVISIGGGFSGPNKRN